MEQSDESFFLTCEGVNQQQFLRSMAFDGKTNKGHNVTLVLPLTHDMHRCAVCDLILRKPVQVGCGERFCQLCADELFLNPNAICPACNEPLKKSEVFRDAFAEREVNSLHAYCTFKKNGCTWEDELRHFEEHVAGCQFAGKPCPIPGCDEHVPQHLMADHMKETCLYRLIPCELCKQPVAVILIKRHQEKDCPERRVQCPHDCCEERIPFSSLANHITDECPNVKLDCAYAPSGCPAKAMTRQEREEHEVKEQVFHLKIVSKRCLQLEEVVLSFQRLANKMAQQHTEQEQKVSDLAEKIGKLQSSSIGPNQEFLEQRSLPAFGDRLENLEREQNVLKQIAHAADQSAQEARAMVNRCQTQTEQSSLLNHCLEEHLNKTDQALVGQQTALSELSLQVDLLSERATDGVLVWKISSIKQRLADAQSGKTRSLFSPPFYTSMCGYKMCARVYLDGDGCGRGTHISLFFVLMNGRYDALLCWPFQLKVSMMILDQSARSTKQHLFETFRPDPYSLSFHRPTEDMNIGSGCPLFAPKSVLDSPTYVHDDALFIKFVVNKQKDGFIKPDGDTL